ncbi:MAG: hypothetical protein ACFCVG_18465 [Kineosporiaceae bacterium]
MSTRFLGRTGGRLAVGAGLVALASVLAACQAPSLPPAATPSATSGEPSAPPSTVLPSPEPSVSASEPSAPSSEPSLPPSAAASSLAGDSKLILLQGPNDWNDTPSTRTPALLENQEHVERMSETLDGIVLDFSIGWNAMQDAAEPVDCDHEEETWVEPLVESGAVAAYTDNMLRLQIRPADIWDDADAARIAENWGCLGRLAVATGAQGLFVDTENYDSADDTPWDDSIYNWDPNGPHTREEFDAQIRARFREWTAAYMAEFPEGTLLLSRGSIDAGQAPEEIDMFSNPEHFEGTIPAMLGSIEAATTPQQVIDSMQLYWLRTAEDYQAACSWTRDSLPETDEGAVIPEDMLDEWQSLPCAHGFYDKDWPLDDPDYVMTPDVFRDQLQAAATVDAVSYRWMFLENGDLMDADYPTRLPDWFAAIEEVGQTS